MSTLIINFATEIQIEPLFKFFINFDFWSKNGHLTHCERRLQDDVPMTVLPSSRRANYQQECSFLICISSFFPGLTYLDVTTSSTSISVFSSVAWATSMRFSWETEKTFEDAWTVYFLTDGMSYHSPRYFIFSLFFSKKREVWKMWSLKKCEFGKKSGKCQVWRNKIWNNVNL